MNISQQVPVDSPIPTATAYSTTSIPKSGQTPVQTDFKPSQQTPTGDNESGGNYGLDDLNSGDPYGEGMYERGITHFGNRVKPVVTHS